LEDEDFHLFEAVSWNPELERIFKNNRYGSAHGVVGCAMSHYTLWKHIATTKNQLHLILEDDAIFKQGWLKKWNREYALDLPRNAFVSSSSPLFLFFSRFLSSFTLLFFPFWSLGWFFSSSSSYYYHYFLSS
jgi:GR25 family glycosyltransferase involved in LPS biosynthesis